MFVVKEMSSEEKIFYARAFWSVNVMLRQQPLNDACVSAWQNAFSDLAKTNPYQALNQSFDHFICLALLEPEAARKMEDSWTRLFKTKAQEDPSLALIVLSEAHATLQLYLCDIDEVDAHQTTGANSFVKKINGARATQALHEMHERMIALSLSLNEMIEKKGPLPPLYTTGHKNYARYFGLLRPHNDN